MKYTLEAVKAMTDEELRVIIGKMMGYTPRLRNEIHLGAPHKWTEWWKDGEPQSLPSYPDDLNACHEFESSMIRSLHQWKRYSDLLMQMAQDDWYPMGAVDARYRSVGSSARRRCEAFLMVTGGES